MPSKLKTHSHYRLLRTRSWSHRQSKLICWQLRKNIRSIGYICGQQFVAIQRERKAVFRAELPQSKYLTYASLIQIQLPDSRIWKWLVTCCASALIELDRELRSRSEAYLLTHLLQTSLLPVVWMQTWVSQPKQAQLSRVAFMMRNKWELVLPSLTWAVRMPSR